MKLHKQQAVIANSNKRFRVIKAGRRGGKTVLSVDEIKGCLLYIEDARVLYIAPTYQAARDIIWGDLKRELSPIAIDVNESRLEITVRNLKGGTSKVSLRAWQAVETLRGQKFHFIVLDEVAMMRNFTEGWEQVIRPTLTDYKGKVMFLSTPKGYNHFYELYNRVDEDWESFSFTSYDNPYIPQEELDKARQELPPDVFNQEYLAEFIKLEGSTVFKNWRQCIEGSEEAPLYRHEYVMGVDLARTQDRTVIIVADTNTNKVVYWEVLERTPWSAQKLRIENVARMYNNAYIVIDATGVGDAFVEQLYSSNLRIEAFKISGNQVKRGLIERLQMFLENKYITFPKWKLLEEEIDAFEYGISNSGTVTFSAPSGAHDDCVLSLSLLVHKLQPKPIPIHTMSDYETAVDRGFGLSNRTGYFQINGN